MFFRNLTAVQKGLVLVLVPVFFELLMLAMLASTLRNAEHTLHQIDYSRRAVLQLQGVEAKMVDGIITGMDQREGQAKQIAAITQVIGLLQSPGRLGNLSAEANPELQIVFRQVNRLNNKLVNWLMEWREVIVQRQLTVADRQNEMPNLAVMARMLELQMVYKKISNIENATTAAEPQKLAQVRYKISLAVAIGIFVSFAISLALAAFFTSDILNRLKRLNASATSLVAKAILPRPAPGRDELAQLERSLYEASITLSDLRRKESAMLDNAVDVICSLDERLRFSGANAAVFRVWQYVPDEIIGMSVINLIEPEKQNLARMAFQQVAEGTGSGSVENRLRSKDGLLKDALWRVKWSEHDKKYFCVVHDVTALRAVEKLRAQFLSMVCHDLRNPIMSVGVGLELLAAREAVSMGEGVKSELRKIKSGSDNLAALTTEFLALEKLQSGLSITNERMVSMLDACAVALESVEEMSTQARVEFDAPSEDGTVWADEDRLVQAIANFLTHAVKVSPRGTTVKMEVDTTDGMLELRIIDKGPVIASQDRALLFERFKISGGKPRQEGDAYSSKISFGLAAAKAIVEGHRGKVGAGLDKKGCNCLWMRLPAYTPDGGDEP